MSTPTIDDTSGARAEAHRRTEVAPLELIAGVWQEPALTLDHDLSDPNTGELRRTQRATAPADLERAIQAGTAIHEEQRWNAVDVEDRARLLRAAANELDARAEQIAACDAMESGVPIAVTRQTTPELGRRFRAAAALIVETPRSRRLEAGGRDVRLLRLPWGPAAVLTPWNAPTFVAANKVANAVAVGCPVILKPSEWAPSGCQLIAEAIVAAGFPDGVFQLVHGAAPQGAALTSDPRIRAVSFTGGQAGGRAIARAATDFKALQLELGGNNPVLVLADADIDATAHALAAGITKLNGQWCEGPGRILVAEELEAPVVAALLDHLSHVPLGHSLDDGTLMGPISNRQHYERLRSQIDALLRDGGTARTAVSAPGRDGWFLSPTIVSGVTPERARDELFGPVVTIHPTESVYEMLDLANHPASGLAGYVFGGAEDTAIEIGIQVEAGEVRVNGTGLVDLGQDSAQSFWAASGIGGHGVVEQFEFFAGTRVVGVDDPDFAL